MLNIPIAAATSCVRFEAYDIHRIVIWHSPTKIKCRRCCRHCETLDNYILYLVTVRSLKLVSCSSNCFPLERGRARVSKDISKHVWGNKSFLLAVSHRPLAAPARLRLWPEPNYQDNSGLEFLEFLILYNNSIDHKSIRGRVYSWKSKSRQYPNSRIVAWSPKISSMKIGTNVRMELLW